MEDVKKERKLILMIFGGLFLAVTLILILLFISGKRTYTITFDIGDGELTSGDLVQKILTGEDATPPKATLEGMYIAEWEGDYKKVNKNSTVTAVWKKQETASTPGIIYSDSEFKDYTTIVGAYEHLSGKVYIGSSFNNKRILCIEEGAFKDFDSITFISLPSKLDTIEAYAFESCSYLKEAELPKTLKTIGEGAFKDCKRLEEITLGKNVKVIEAEAFKNCEALEEIIIPESVKVIGADAFADCENLTIKLYIKESEMPEGFAEGCFGNATVIFEYVPETEENEEVTK